MHFAFADPPYLGCCKLYDHFHGTNGRCWDDPETYRAFFEHLTTRWPDGWALCASSTSLQTLLPLIPPDTSVRIAAWVKPFAAYKRNVRIAYTWEPVIFYKGRTSSKDGAYVNRDYLAESITMRKGFTGAKPERFCRWTLDLLGWKPGDKVDDLYPGTKVFSRVLAAAEASPEILRYV